MEKQTAKVHFSTLTATYSRVNSSTTKQTALENTSTKVVRLTKAIGLMIFKREMVSKFYRMEVYTVDSSITA